MTSVERQEGNAYGSKNETEPDYSILTYTWGRWPAPGGPHIQVSGTTWTIPAVDESKFTVASFHEVINKMGEVHDFAWIDVVCIDQENYEVKMDEIGKQVGIFANASRVYVWLWTLPITRLQAAYDEITRCSASLQDNEDVWGKLRQPPGDVLPSLEASIKTILGDWWFSSLWTLQEGLLRQDAILLSQDAGYVKHLTKSDENPMAAIRYLAKSFSNLRAVLESEDTRFTNAPYCAVGSSIIQYIHRSGYPTALRTSNPNIQWAAARFRTTTFQQDRIYGIMALYNIQVGDAVPNASIRKDRSFSELELEFATALNTKSPLLGQMFVHAAPPHAKTWQISHDIIVPPEYSSYDKEQSSTCSIMGNPTGFAQVEGRVCCLKDLARLWKEYSRQPWWSSHFNAVLDEYIIKSHPAIYNVPTYLSGLSSIHTKPNSILLVDSILKEFGEDTVSVLELGAETRRGRSYYLYGLLLLHAPQDRSRSKRIGLCKWPAESLAQALKPAEWVRHHGILE
ncbi:hypothetical protein PG994_002389 [Apiospora phragmitis]|uniref:Heterokaryon incompatibility domain-containing protein n=1 Tax=Apiospora phragmitis TaxID=2905665 RepID=A0ABR1WW72_9PEZI